jgi:hypothetical protein
MSSDRRRINRPILTHRSSPRLISLRIVLVDTRSNAAASPTVISGDGPVPVPFAQGGLVSALGWLPDRGSFGSASWRMWSAQVGRCPARSATADAGSKFRPRLRRCPDRHAFSSMPYLDPPAQPARSRIRRSSSRGFGSKTHESSFTCMQCVPSGRCVVSCRSISPAAGFVIRDHSVFCHAGE